MNPGSWLRLGVMPTTKLKKGDSITMHQAFTIRLLAAIGLLAATTAPAFSQAPPDRDVFALFCKLDAQSGQLTDDGWQKIAALFVNPGKPRRDRIIISDGGGPLRSTPEGGKLGVGREYIRFGQIDFPQVRFSNGELPPGAKIREGGLHVIKVSGPGAPEEWRIEGPVPLPVVTVNAAIRYVIEIRTNTKDAVIKKNADRTLAALRRFR
jgi:hypothetical protein